MVERRYWDTACFSAWFADEEHRAEVCGAILTSAEEGSIQIVTSALAIAEVLLPKGGPRLDPSKRHQVTQFFKKPQLLVVQLDRTVAQEAQRYVWDFGVKPKDAVHVASAIRAGVPTLETYDDGLVKLSGRLGGSPVLHIRHPVALDTGDGPSLFDV